MRKPRRAGRVDICSLLKVQFFLLLCFTRCLSSLVAVHSPPSETKIDAIPIGGPSDLRRLQVAFTSPSNTTPAPQRRLPQAKALARGVAFANRLVPFSVPLTPRC